VPLGISPPVGNNRPAHLRRVQLFRRVDIVATADDGERRFFPRAIRLSQELREGRAFQIGRLREAAHFRKRRIKIDEFDNAVGGSIFRLGRRGDN
jgi:hypothetical protein